MQLIFRRSSWPALPIAEITRYPATRSPWPIDSLLLDGNRTRDNHRSYHPQQRQWSVVRTVTTPPPRIWSLILVSYTSVNNLLYGPSNWISIVGNWIFPHSLCVQLIAVRARKRHPPAIDRHPSDRSIAVFPSASQQSSSWGHITSHHIPSLVNWISIQLNNFAAESNS